MEKWDKLPLRMKYIVAMGSSFILFTCMTGLLVIQILDSQRMNKELEIAGNHLAQIDQLSSELSQLYIAMSLYAGDPMPVYLDDYKDSKRKVIALKDKALTSIPTINWIEFDKILNNMSITFEKRIPESIADKNNVSKRRQLKGLHKNTENMLANLNAFRTEQDVLHSKSLEIVENRQQQTIVIVIVAFLIAITLSTLLLITTNRQTRTQLTRVADKANGISLGNLVHEDLQIHSLDEIGQVSKAMNHMKNKLTTMIMLIQETALQLTDNSAVLQEFSAETQEGSKRVENSMHRALKNSQDQSESAKKIQLFLHSFSTQMSNYRNQSQKLFTQSIEVELHSKKSNSIMAKTVEQMNQMQQLLVRAESERERLQARTNEIVQVADQVQSISKQTNLLALNAGIEAARSGVHGKGFAVVAEEVRILSGQVSVAANHIRSLSAEITKQGQSMSEVFAEGLTASKTSGQAVYETSKNMETITNFIHTTRLQFEEMENMMQNLECDQKTTHESIEELTSAIQQNTSLIQETTNYLAHHSNSIDSLSERIEDVGRQSETLQSSTSQFQLN